MAQGAINGKSVNFMVDTGATTIAMSAADAQRLGLTFDGGRRGLANTAGGSIFVGVSAKKDGRRQRARLRGSTQLGTRR